MRERERDTVRPAKRCMVSIADDGTEGTQSNESETAVVLINC